jgi:hypothetical protein
MTEKLKNAKPANGGKVHKVVWYDKYTHEEIDMATFKGANDYPKRGRVCELEHDPFTLDYNGWWDQWQQTDEPITCGNCLRMFWPDGRHRE